MNIMDAVRTGLPIRRASWHDMLTVQPCDCGQPGQWKHSECPEPSYRFPDSVEPLLTPQDLLADDWTTEVR